MESENQSSISLIKKLLLIALANDVAAAGDDVGPAGLGIGCGASADTGDSGIKLADPDIKQVSSNDTKSPGEN
jgi:hypothetical protein